MLTADAHAASSPSVAVPAAQVEPANWLGASRKTKQVSDAKSRDAKAGRRSCWEYQRMAGRWKRTNVCFSEGR